MPTPVMPERLGGSSPCPQFPLGMGTLSSRASARRAAAHSQPFPSPTQWPPGLEKPAGLSPPSGFGRLLQTWVELDLVDGRNDLVPVEDGLEMPRLKVGDSDRAGTPAGVDLFECPPRREVRADGRHRPVDHIQVEVVETEPVQTLC